MTAVPETLVVVFDGAKARFFDYLPNGKLEPLREMESDLHRFARDQGSDKPGRTFASTTRGVRHSIEPRHDPHKMEKHNFVQAIVEALADAFDHGRFKQLAIVAPERSLGEFRALAPEKLLRLLWKAVPKELAHYPDHELEARLAPYFEAGNKAVTPQD